MDRAQMSLRGLRGQDPIGYTERLLHPYGTCDMKGLVGSQ